MTESDPCNTQKVPVVAMQPEVIPYLMDAC